MPLKSITSVELSALVNEMQCLVNGKVSQIYNFEKELLLQIHSTGKKLLRIVSGKLVCLTENKETALKPSSFCMQLRKYLGNAVIRSIEQKDSERIVVFELEKKEKYYLIVELFSKGNVILTDEPLKIIGLLEQQVWKDRTIMVKEKYLFPSQGVNWKKITETELDDLLKKSERKNLATSLATEMGLGGLYAEEVCKRAGINKGKLPPKVEEKEVKALVKEIKEFLKLMEHPSGYIYEEGASPFPLIGRVAKKTTPTYSEALEFVDSLAKTSPYEHKKSMVEKVIREQEESVKQLEQKIILNKTKGEKIYEHYVPLQKLLNIVTELRKSKDWNEISGELKKEKKIKLVDLKNKRVTIEL